MAVDLSAMGVDLRDWFRGTLSTRWLLWHAAELTEDSRVQRELERREIGEAAAWSVEAHLLANLIDLQRQEIHLHEVWLWANSDEKKRPKDPPEAPKPMPRPGSAAEKPKEDQPIRFATTAELMARFNQPK